MVIVKEYGKGTIRNYCQEMMLLFKYCHQKPVAGITQADVENYLQYIKEVHKAGRAKCRSVAQSCSFFFKRVMPAGYIVPSNLYPRKHFVLPNIMGGQEVARLFAAPLTLKEYCVVGLLYGCGLRISEVCNLRLQDIESSNKRIKVYQGKGGRDRYTLLPEILLPKLRQLYVGEGRPKEYLFTSKQTKRAVHVRSMQVIVNAAIAKAGFKDKGITKIRHAGFLHSRDKTKRMAVVCNQLQLPAPMPKVAIPVALRLLVQAGKDITLCPVCKTGKLQLVQTLIFHNGALVDARLLRNRGSPKKNKAKCQWETTSHY